MVSSRGEQEAVRAAGAAGAARSLVLFFTMAMAMAGAIGAARSGGRRRHWRAAMGSMATAPGFDERMAYLR